MPSSFHTLPPSKPDPIFAIAGEAKAAGKSAIDGTIGVFLNEEGSTFLFPSVMKAVKEVAAAMPDRSFSYGKLLGVPEYREAVGKLILGDRWNELASIASTGGTGAVALNLRLAKLMDPDITVLLPVPAWANHPPLCRAANMTTVEVPYFENGQPSIRGIIDGLNKTTGSVAVLLQTGCHNPSGLDFTKEQWTELYEAMKKREAIAILDLAYQGFGSEPEDDAEPIRMCVDAGITTLIAWSASKNHAIYCERTGLAAAYVPDAKMRAEVEAHYSTLTRGIHSAAASVGQQIVARTQMAYQQEWLEDMRGARAILEQKRDILKKAVPESMRQVIDGRGMFALLPLTPSQIMTLKTEHKVFMTSDGRINIAGIPLARMEELGEKLTRIYQASLSP